MEQSQNGGSCIIETKIGGSAHGILLCTTEAKKPLKIHLHLKSEYAKKSTVVLITNHHVIPNIGYAKGCKIKYDNRNIKLDDKKLIKCISCCGENGILGKYEHVKIKSGEGDDCPFQLDFTILFLNIKLVTEQLKSLQFSFNYYFIRDITDLLKNNKLQCIQRASCDTITSCDLTLLKSQDEALNKILDNQEEEVEQYNNLATFTTEPQSEIVEGSSGAPIFVCESQSNQKELVAIHRLTVCFDKKVVMHKHTNIFWILLVTAIYQGTKHCISILILNYFRIILVTKIPTHSSSCSDTICGFIN